MPNHAACTGSEVPAAQPHRDQAAAHRYSPATSLLPSVLRVRWDPSPCGRLSRPRSTTVPPPRPGSNSGRCACPSPQGLDGHHQDASHVHHAPVGRVGAQLYPCGITARHPTHRTASPAPTSIARTRRPPSQTEDEHRDSPQPPVPELVTDRGASTTGSVSLHLSALLARPGRWRRPVGTLSGLLPPKPLTSGVRLPPASPGHYGGRGWAPQPTR
jgi:hypothetical protein